MNLKQAALRLAQAGWRIHPLRPNRKQPLIKEWQKQATTNVEQVEAWWQKWPNANIGIATGGRIVVVDLDVKHAPIDGIDEWTGFCLTHDIDDETLTAKTPSGGLHLFFSKSIEIHNSAGRIAPGVDVRGDGGFVVAAPSVVGGKMYAWEMPPKRIAPLPGMVAEIIKYVPPPEIKPGDLLSTGKDCSAYVKAALSNSLDELSNARPGTKHDTLNRVAFGLGQLIGSPWSHLDRGDVERLVWAVVEKLPDVESYEAAQRTMDRALDEGARNPRPEPKGDYPVKVELYGQDTIKPRHPLLIVDDQDTAIMCLETVEDKIGVLAPTRAGVPWMAAWSNLVVGCDALPVIVWMKEIAKSVQIANALLSLGVKVRVYRGEAQDLKPWLRGLL